MFAQHERSEGQLRLVGIVGAAAKLDVANRRFPSASEGHDVMELQKAALGTSAGGSDKRAPGAIPPPDFPSNRSRDMTRARRYFPRLPRAVRGGEPLSIQIGEQSIQGALEHGGHISVGDRMPQQGLRPLQLLVRVA